MLSSTTAQTVNDPDILYVNINCTNLDNIDQTPKPLTYTETRSSPILYYPSNFYMSIVKFTIDTQTLPVYIMPIQPNQSDPNLSTLQVGFIYNGDISNHLYTTSQYIQFIPQIKNIPIPNAPNINNPPVQDNSQEYYNILTYEYFIDLINTALATAYADINTQIVALGLGDTTLSTNPPIMTWNGATLLASINYGGNGILGSTIDQQPKIQMNNALYSLFSSFNASISGFYNNLLNATLIWNNQGLSSMTIEGGYVINQEYDTTANINPVTGLVFTSNSIPIVPEAISKPLLSYNNTQLANFGSNNNTANIITDFSSDALYKPNVYYVPSAQYRYTQLISQKPFNTIDISVYYRIKTGELVPFRLASGGNLTMKMLFQKKDTIGGIK